MPLPVGPLEQWGEARQGADRSLHPVDFYVFGHYHTVVDRVVSGARLIVLGDWITNMSFGTFDGREFKIHRVESAEKW